MKMYFAEICNFNWLFDEKYQIFDGSEFPSKVMIIHDAYCFQLRAVLDDNSLRMKIDFEFASEKSRCSINDLEHLSEISLFICSA